ncbi:MAG: DUF3703 domain-containing protein [Saprospiraceae bacterium]|nr:DUF3703 domain-containing protein [Saprospiraceae bacterium]
MKLHWSMPTELKAYFGDELVKYKLAFTQNQLHLAWSHLERAHIINQAFPKEHSLVHWKMLLFGFKIKNWKEIRGQILRLIFGGVKSFVGTIPIGNTGGANVPALLPMEIPEDIKLILKSKDGAVG